MSQIFKLYRLQQVDTQILSAQKRINEIEAILQDETDILRATQDVAQCLEQLKRAENEEKLVEAEAERLKGKYQQNQNSLYGGKVRNPKELQDLQSESQALQNQLRVIEDRQLDIMIAKEEAEEKLHKAEQARDQVLQHKLRRDFDLRQELNTLTSNLERLLSERQVILSSIPSSLYEQYEQIKTLRGGVAVTLVTNNTCAACGTTISAALRNIARSSDQVTLCNLCGRILYVD